MGVRKIGSQAQRRIEAELGEVQAWVFGGAGFILKEIEAA